MKTIHVMQLHVYAQNAYYDEWNTFKLKLLPGKEFTNIATDSKKDDCTELANITMPTNPRETGNLKTILTVKINARVMITTNINVTDGLTNGTMGTVTNVVIDERTGKMSTILVSLDSKHVGQEAMHANVHKSTNQNVVPIYQTQAIFPIHKKASYQATRSHLVTLFSLEQNNFFPGTQAFASPPDLASSGVWENIILSKTPTFDGV